jgi:hypothetical protein
MQLSDTDKKLVERLKNRQRQFIRWRWVGLLAAILCIGIGIYAFVVLQQFAQEPALPSVMAIAYLSPVVFFSASRRIWFIDLRCYLLAGQAGG